MLKSFTDILSRAKEGSRKRIAVAGAEGEAVLKAISAAAEADLVEAVLIGNEEKINKIANDIDISLADVEIHNVLDENEIAHHAVSLVDQGKVDGLMKGKVSTPSLLKAVLDKQYNLRTGRLLSHVSLLEIPSYHKLLMITDGGMVITPDFNEKVAIIKNGVEIMHKLGVAKPKIAVLAAIEKVNPKMIETEHAAELAAMSQRGELGECLVEGPMAVDVAFSPEAAAIKGIDSAIAGDPDILLVPNIACGNIFAKGLWHLAKAKIAGLVVGARKPVILLSRSDNAETKLNSIALGAVSS